MKIAVSATGESEDDLMSERFGRCNYFIIYNEKTREFEEIPNVSKDVQSGAGPKAVETIVAQGSDVLLAGHVGEKAAHALKSAGINVVNCYSDNVTVKDAVNKFLKVKDLKK